VSVSEIEERPEIEPYSLGEPRLFPAYRGLEFVGAFAAALFALFTFFPPSGTALLPWLFGPIAVIVALSFLLRAFDPRPRLEIDDAGFTHRHAFFFGDVFVPWSDIDDVEQSSGHVLVRLRDGHSVLRDATWARKLDLLARRLFAPDTLSLRPPPGYDAAKFDELIETSRDWALRKELELPRTDSSA
jgi:hypothetical protein